MSGSERANLINAGDKSTVQAAIPPFYAAKAGYDALAEVIAKGKELEVDMTEAETFMANEETTAADAAAMAEELKHLVKLAYNTSKATEGADMTFVIVNPSFETGNTQGWTHNTSGDTGAKPNDNASYTMSNCDGNYLFNTLHNSIGYPISQTIEDLPLGTYKLEAIIATDNGHQVQLNANNKNVMIDADAEGKGIGVNGELEFNVLDNTATIGAEGVDSYWYKVDNFRLTFIKAIIPEQIVADYWHALQDAQDLLAKKMNKDVASELESTINTYGDVPDTDIEDLIEATVVLTNAISVATASIAAYENAGTVLPKMQELTESTNFYTEAAYEEYYSQWVTKYEANELTTDEANALQNPFAITGWHDGVTCDDFLLSAWDAPEAGSFQGYYINTWSTEGIEGSDNYSGVPFGVPFFEYWTENKNSLDAKTLTGTMSGMDEGTYIVTALVRVRTKDGVSAPATGVTMQVNDGEAVNVSEGTKTPEAPMYQDEFTAIGKVGEDGVLNIRFIVADGNNISWLSFKNVNYKKMQPSEDLLQQLEELNQEIGKANSALETAEDASDDAKATLSQVINDATALYTKGIIGYPDVTAEDVEAMIDSVKRAVTDFFTAVGITSVTAAQKSGTIYTLNGQKVSGKLQKGLYIIDGKVVVIK